MGEFGVEVFAQNRCNIRMYYYNLKINVCLLKIYLPGLTIKIFAICFKPQVCS